MKRIIFFISLLITTFHIQSQEVFSDYDGFWKKDIEISVIDLIPFYPGNLGKIRNEVFARYGRTFKTRSYQDYFLSTDWYKVIPEYQESWPSRIDMRNAQLIFSVERPQYSRDQVNKIVLQNIQYTGNNINITFTGSDTVIWSDTRVDFGGMYGSNGQNNHNMRWIYFGDWILVYRKGYLEYEVIAYKLNHTKKSVDEMVFQNVADNVFRTMIDGQ